MAFSVKNWVDAPSLSTPITAAALEDLETRLSAYSDAAAAAGGYTDEQVRDVIGATLTTGGATAITVDDALNTIKIGEKFAVAPPTGVAATDNANIVAALAAALAAGGGRVQLQAGNYEITVDTISVPANTMLAGAGAGITWLHKRANGVAVNMSGTNNGAGRKLYAQACDFSIHGHDFTGQGIRQFHISQGHIFNVGVTFNNDTALDIVDCWDTTYFNIFLDWSGSYNGTNPALRIRNSAHASDAALGFNATQQTNMVRFYATRIESFRYGVAIERGTGSSIDPYFISFDGIKLETNYTRNFFFAMQNVRAVHVRDLDCTAIGFDSGVTTPIIAIFWAPLFESSLENIRFFQSAATWFDTGIDCWTPGAGSHLLDGISFEGADAITSAIKFETASPIDVRNVYSPTVAKRFTAAGDFPWAPTVASAATMTVPLHASFVKVTGTTGITAISGPDGTEITFKFASSLTVTNGANLKLAGAANMSATADDTLTLINIGGVWYEKGRSVN